MLTVCLNFMWLLVLTIVGYTLQWSLQCGGLKGHSDGRAKSIHSVRLLQRSGQSPKVRCTACHWSVAGKVHLPWPRAKVARAVVNW